MSFTKRAILLSAFGFLLSAFLPAYPLTYEVVSTGRCRMLGYSSEKKQTDHDPFSTASGTRPKWGTVATNQFPLWTRLKIQGMGEKIFTVEDRMHKRYNNVVDIWFPSKDQARKFGARNLKYSVLKNVRPLPK